MRPTLLDLVTRCGQPLGEGKYCWKKLRLGRCSTHGER